MFMGQKFDSQISDLNFRIKQLWFDYRLNYTYLNFCYELFAKFNVEIIQHPEIFFFVFFLRNFNS